MTTASPLSWPDGWPHTPASKRFSAYRLKATFDKARTEIYGEIRRLGATSLVISCNLALRRDGQHSADRADHRLDDPGVAVYFTLRERPMVIASDRYETPAANLRSIGLAIEHLRGLERHGGGHMMERAFGGFAALPPPDGQREEVVNWRTELAPIPDGLENTDILIIAESRYRAKAKEAHSDNTGGDDTKMIRLNAAIAQARAELAP